MSKLINQPSYSTRPTLRVDLPQIRANYEALKARVGAAKIGASVKADAYGLGAVAVGKTLYGAGCRIFFVATAGEGKMLRDGVGPNAAIYVLNGPAPRDKGVLLGAKLKPVINSLEQARYWALAPILQVRWVKKGESLGYNGTYIAPRDMRVAVVGAGYADGVPVNQSNTGTAILHDEEVKIVGRVSMDLTMIDATDANLSVEVGGVVIFRGKHLEAEAKQSDTINYELLVRLGQRCRRDYWKPKKEDADAPKKDFRKR